jgi:hypothetical protein
VAQTIRRKDIKRLEEKIQELSKQQRKTSIEIIEKIEKSSSKIISAMFLESRSIREQIGYQTMMFKTLQDNISQIQFDEGMGVSSKIEVSVGAEILGTGAKWVLDIDTGKASYGELLRAIEPLPGIPDKIKEKAKSKLKKFFKKTR